MFHNKRLPSNGNRLQFIGMLLKIFYLIDETFKRPIIDYVMNSFLKAPVGIYRAIQPKICASACHAFDAIDRRQTDIFLRRNEHFIFIEFFYDIETMIFFTIMTERARKKRLMFFVHNKRINNMAHSHAVLIYSLPHRMENVYLKVLKVIFGMSMVIGKNF